MEQHVKGFKGFTPVKMCGLSPLASFYLPELSVGDISDAPASTAPNLGVLFDPNLKFDLFLNNLFIYLFVCCCCFCFCLCALDHIFKCYFAPYK